MDRETLSHYGWIIVVLICMAIIISLATPFGRYIGTVTSNVADGVQGATNQIDREQASADMGDLFLGDSENVGNINISGSNNTGKVNSTIPQGGIYFPEGDLSYPIGDGYMMTPVLTATRAKFAPDFDTSVYIGNKPDGGDAFPELKDGDIFIYGSYQYVYNATPYDRRHITLQNAPDYKIEQIDGWYVMEYKPQKEAQPILTEINGKKVKNIDWLFKDNTKLTDASKFVIPDSVTSAVGVFYKCSSLTKAPVIPSTLKVVTRMFMGCTSLRGNIEVNTNPTNYGNFLANVDTSNITITGITSCKTELLKTDTKETSKYNKLIYTHCCETASIVYEDGMTFAEFKETPYYDEYAIQISDSAIYAHYTGRPPTVSYLCTVDKYGNNIVESQAKSSDKIENATLQNATFLVKTVTRIIETAHDPYDNNMNYVLQGIWNMSEIKGVKSVNVEITYQTEGVGWDWISIVRGDSYISGTSTSTYTYLLTDGTLSTLNSGAITSVKFGGKTKETKEFKNLNMLAGSVILRTDSSINTYYGATVKITANF